LRAWQSEHKKGLIELALFFALALVVWLLGYQLGVRRVLIDWTSSGTAITPIDFFLPTLVLAGAFPLFALRRGRELRDEISRANTDALTGLHNRRKFSELLEHEVLRARRHSRALSLVMLDVDRLKDVNDKFGHDVGDSVLKAVGEVGRQLIRQTDHFARWGGDEFMIIAPETPAEGAEQLAEKVRAALAEQMFPSVGRLSASVGLTSLVPGDDAETLVRRADRLLLAAKEEGRNRVTAASHPLLGAEGGALLRHVRRGTSGLEQDLPPHAS
jgi:diguanylate cyclase (GGDEF)-like protein